MEAEWDMVYVLHAQCFRKYFLAQTGQVGFEETGELEAPTEDEYDEDVAMEEEKEGNEASSGYLEGKGNAGGMPQTPKIDSILTRIPTSVMDVLAAYTYCIDPLRYLANIHSGGNSSPACRARDLDYIRAQAEPA